MSTPKRVRRLSHSQVSEWPDSLDTRSPGCAFKWFLNHLTDAPKAPGEAGIVGDGLHRACELDGLAKLAGSQLSQGELITIARDEIDRRLAESDPGGSLQGVRHIMMARVESMIGCYVRIAQPRYTPTAPPEYEFLIDIGGVAFGGKVDARTSAAVIDWKNTKELVNKWGKEWIENLEHTDQADAYMLAIPDAPMVRFIVFACHPDQPDVCAMKIYTVQRNEPRAAKYAARVQRTHNEIEAAVLSGAFPAKTGNLCPWCAFIGTCTFGQTWAKIAHKPIAVPALEYVIPCACGDEMRAVDFQVQEKRGLVTFACQACGVRETQERRRYKKEVPADAQS